MADVRAALARRGYRSRDFMLMGCGGGSCTHDPAEACRGFLLGPQGGQYAWRLAWDATAQTWSLTRWHRLRRGAPEDAADLAQIRANLEAWCRLMGNRDDAASG
jgi:hypothetical protein